MTVAVFSMLVLSPVYCPTAFGNAVMPTQPLLKVRSGSYWPYKTQPWKHTGMLTEWLHNTLYALLSYTDKCSQSLSSLRFLVAASNDVAYSVSMSSGSCHRWLTHFSSCCRAELQVSNCPTSSEGQNQSYFTTGGLSTISSLWRQAPWASWAEMSAFLFGGGGQLNTCDRRSLCNILANHGRVSALWTCFSRSQSNVMTNGHSASLSWCQAPTWGPRTDFYYCQAVTGSLVWGAFYDERAVLSFTIPSGPRQRSHSRASVPRDSWPYFTLSDSRLSQLGGSGPRYITQEQGGPVILPGTGIPSLQHTINSFFGLVMDRTQQLFYFGSRGYRYGPRTWSRFSTTLHASL
jgi:hypothetical protein